MNRIAAASILALTLSACGGGGGTVPTTASSSNDSTQSVAATVTLTILIPHATTASSTQRRPQYISPATQSAMIAPSGASSQLFALTPTSPHCTDSSAALTCTLNVSAIVGQSKSIAVSTYATVNGSGTPLSRGTVVTNVVAGQANPLTITLNGVVAAISVVLTPNHVTKGSAAQVQLVVNALDVSGNTIIAPGDYVDSSGNPVTITLDDVDSSGSTTLSQTMLTQTTAGLTISYNGSNSFSTASISATASNGPNGSANLTGN